MTGNGKDCCGPGYASPQEAMQAEPEKLLYSVALYTGTGVEAPDYLATIDVDPESPTYSQIVNRLEMPNIGDELHHIGWNACSSCHHDASKERRYLIVPGVRSTRLHIVDCASDPRAPKIHKVIEGDEIKQKDQPVGTAHGSLPGLRYHHFHAGRCGRRRPWRLSARQRGFRHRRPLGKRHHRYELQLRFLVSAAPQCDGVERMGGAQHLHAWFRPGRRFGRQVRPFDPFLGLRGQAHRQQRRPRRRGHDPARSALPPRPRQHPRFRGRHLVVERVPLAQERRGLGSGEDHRHSGHGSRRLADPGAVADHRYPGVDGRQVPLLLQLAPRRSAPV